MLLVFDKVRFLMSVIFGSMKARMQDQSPSLPGSKVYTGCEAGAIGNLGVKLDDEANRVGDRVN